MDAVTLINEHLDIDKLLEYYNFESVNSDNSNIIRACCKLHEGNNPTSFAINRETGLWYCHSNCGGGDALSLVQHFEKCSFIESAEFLAKLFSLNISDLEIKLRQPFYIKNSKEFIKLMQKPKEMKPFFINEEIHPVTKYRKFKPETLKHFNLGFVNKVELAKRDTKRYILYNRLVFPIMFKGIQVGISFRRIKSKDMPKWSHQPVDFNTGSILYNYDNIGISDYVVVCEGINDVWAFYEVGVTAVATLGAHITDIQYKLLLKTGANLVLAFDGDEAGRLITDKAKLMFKHKANLSVIHFDEGEDPENIDREVLKSRYNNRTKI